MKVEDLRCLKHRIVRIHVGVSKNRGIPEWKTLWTYGWFGGETPIFGNTHVLPSVDWKDLNIFFILLVFFHAPFNHGETYIDLFFYDRSKKRRFVTRNPAVKTWKLTATWDLLRQKQRWKDHPSWWFNSTQVGDSTPPFWWFNSTQVGDSTPPFWWFNSTFLVIQLHLKFSPSKNTNFGQMSSYPDGMKKSPENTVGGRNPASTSWGW